MKNKKVSCESEKQVFKLNSSLEENIRLIMTQSHLMHAKNIITMCLEGSSKDLHKNEATITHGAIPPYNTSNDVKSRHPSYSVAI